MIELRLAKENEVNLVNSLCNDVKKYYHLWDDEYPNYEMFLEDFNDKMLYVLTLDDKIIGSISIEESPKGIDHISLSRFFIVKEYQRKGYGRFVFQEIERQLKGRYDYLDLFVNTLHPFALKMYQSFGFTDLGESEVEWETIYKYHYLVKNIK